MSSARMLLGRDIDAQQQYFTLMPAPSDSPDPAQSPIEHSPLEREITRDGTTVSVNIYRGNEGGGWLLEVEDELGGSTVWDDPFDTDQAALDEALKTIDEEGIHSLTVSEDDPASRRALWKLAIAEPAIAALKQTLELSASAVSFHRACGIFAAVVSAPEMRRPSEWIDFVKRDHVFRDLDEAQGFANGVMALYSAVLRSLTEYDAHCCPFAEDHESIREFCTGYAMIALGDPTWAQDTRGIAMLLPICAVAGALKPEKLIAIARDFDDTPEHWVQSAREELPETLVALHTYWDKTRKAAAARVQQPQRRAAPKVGRNERCPCGSGKKSKKCCAL